MSIFKIAAAGAVLALTLTGCASTSEEVESEPADTTTTAPEPTDVVEEDSVTVEIPSTNDQDVVSQLRTIADKACSEANALGSIELDEINNLRVVLVPESVRDFGVIGWYEISEMWEPLYETAGHSACALSEDFASLEAAYGSPDSTFEIELVDATVNQYLFTSLETGETREVQYLTDVSGLLTQVNIVDGGEVVLERPVSYGFSDADAATYSAYITELEALSADNTEFTE